MSGEQTHGSVVNLIETFLEKAAADEKKATNLDLAGDAKSTHPSANVDDKTKPATEGSRSSENESDVRKDTPNTINDESSENSDESGNQGATINGDQGTTTMAADSGLQGNVEKPKKDHSQSMSDSGPGDGGESFKGDWDKASSAKSLTGEANSILADLTLLVKGAEAGQQPAPAAAPAAGQQKAAADGKKDEDQTQLVELYKQAAQQFPEDVEAGYTAAALLAQHLGLVKDASAEEASVQAVELLQKEAEADAVMYADFLKGFAEATKQAMPEGMEDPAALAALGNAGEGEAAGGEMGGGGMDIGSLLAGAGGGEEGGMPGAEMMGGEGGDEGAIIEAIAQALDEAGVTPEDLAEAVAAEGGGGEMGMEGGEAEGGAPEGGEAMAAAAEGGGAEGGAAEKYSSIRNPGVRALIDALTKRAAAGKKKPVQPRKK